MILRTALLSTITVLAIGTAAQAAQNAQLVAQGKLLAQSLCADCHTFGVDRRSDRLPPDFRDVGAMPQTTALSLRVFLTSPHANMPDIILEPAQIDALSAFILDLGGK